MPLVYLYNLIYKWGLHNYLYCLYNYYIPVNANEGLPILAIKVQLISFQLVDSKAKWRGVWLYCIWSGVYHLYNCMVTSSTSQLYCR